MEKRVLSLVFLVLALATTCPAQEPGVGGSIALDKTFLGTFAPPVPRYGFEANVFGEVRLGFSQSLQLGYSNNFRHLRGNIKKAPTEKAFLRFNNFSLDYKFWFGNAILKKNRKRNGMGIRNIYERTFKPYIFAGPSVELNRTGLYRVMGTYMLVNRINYGASGGLGCNILKFQPGMSGNYFFLYLEARYFYNILQSRESNSVKVKYNALGLTLGLKWSQWPNFNPKYRH